jgi:hypothetical protein
MTWGQSAVVKIIIKMLYFKATQRLFLNIYKTINIFKRIYTTYKIGDKYKLNARYLSYAYLIGLIEGDG